MAHNAINIDVKCDSDVVTEELHKIEDCRLFQVNLYMLAIFFIKDIHDLANFT